MARRRRAARDGETPAGPIDIESALAGGVVPEAVLDVLRRLGSLIEHRPERVLLVHCDLDNDGDAFVAWDALDLPVRFAPGDVFTAGIGFIWRADLLTLTVAPRLLRLTCSNGQALADSRDLGATGYTWSVAEGARGDLDRTVDWSLSGRVLQAALRALAPARKMRTPEPSRALRALLPQEPRTVRTAALDVFTRRADPTLYGLLNAVTETARDAPDLRTHVDLEEAAGHLIAWLARLGTVQPHAVASNRVLP